MIGTLSLLRSVGGGYLVVAVSFCALMTLTQPAEAEEVTSVEDLLRCSDVVVLATVKETLHDGIVAGPTNMIYTRHVLAVDNYYVGSGRSEIVVLTPGGYERHADGHETVTSIVAEGMIGVRAGESFLAFLQVFPPGYRFLGRRGAKVLVDTDDSAGTRTVRLTFGKPDLLGDSARERYDKLKGELVTMSPGEREIATARLKYALTEAIPVAQLLSRIDRVVKEVGGPKSPNMICY